MCPASVNKSNEYVIILCQSASFFLNWQQPEVWRHQRKLAEILEMIHTGQAIHQAVLNLPLDIDSEEDPGLRDRLQQLEFGNKVDWTVLLIT